ncbi:MAG: XRE family transcriptional regulator [Lachnospiraceae bacterium]|nr:XRE family transcriptional regulator [Lachnospiraceae bacterium]
MKNKMSNITAKTSANVFYQARCKASAHNEQLSSRKGAADIMSIDRGRLYRIESGLVNPYPEEVHLMADLYNAPELRNYYCTEMCPLGCDIPKANADGLDRIAIKALSAFRRLGMAKELLLDITEDGVITEDEKPDLQTVLQSLSEVEEVAQNLKIWAKKNL